MAKYKKAGADAAGAYDDEFKQIIANDPDIQRVIQGVWGTGARPGDTPKHLEKANDRASKQISQILKAKGIELPDRTFVNPRTGAIEGHRGWSGLNGLQKAAIIGAAGATGLGALAATGAIGGAAAGGASAGSGLGVTSGLPAGFSAGATGIGAGGTTLGGGLTTSMLTNAGINAAKTKLTGGSWKDALFSGATGAATGGAGGNMGWFDTLKGVGKDIGKSVGGNLIQNLTSGKSLNAIGQGMGAIGQTQAHNRGVQLDAMMTGDQIRLQAEQDRREAEADIMKKMQIANYIKSGGFKDSGPVMSASGRPITKFNFGTRPTSESEQAMAGELEGQLMNRLRNPIQLSDYASKMEPGKMESIMNWVGPGLAAYGQSKMPDNLDVLRQIMSGQGGQQPPTATPAVQPRQQGVEPPAESSKVAFNPITPRPASNPWEKPLF